MNNDGNYYLLSVDETLRRLNTCEAGLTDAEAGRRLISDGPNELAKSPKKGLLSRFGDQLLNPMIIILLAAAAVSAAIAAYQGEGFSEYAEAGIILAVVILNSVLGVVQESKADKAIESLQEMSASTAKVRRRGTVTRIPAAGLVVGDVVLIEAGDAVPADMRLILSAGLRVEEASLTGESLPSEKQINPLKANHAHQALSGVSDVVGAATDVTDGGASLDSIPLGDRSNMAYMGTNAAFGRGEGVVTATGMDTEMGKIAGIIQGAKAEGTPLQKRLSQLSKALSVIVLCICAVVFAVRLFTAGVYGAKPALDSFMLAVSLAVAAIPEGLAAVVTIVLSAGVSKMARRNAIIRRLTAVETLGCAQVICTDKTGTITQNKMTVTESYGDIALLAPAMALCCDSQLDPGGGIIGDPTENALVAFALAQGFDKNELASRCPRVAEAPFNSARKLMTTVHRVSKPAATEHSVNKPTSTVHSAPGGFVQITKGAPDEVLRACTHALVDGRAVELTRDKANEISLRNKEYAAKALRVLACAYKEIDAAPSDCSPQSIENGLTFIGLEAMIDPVRPDVKAAVDECRNAGVKVVMITGDHRDTALAIANELGIVTGPGQVMTGQELDGLSGEEFGGRIEDTFVYARVQPEHKVRIVNTWKQKGYVTAMTGDGVNDAPAIKSGDIGVGMGITGTDVTKNVADMVLADDNFATIVAAVAEGRRIYDNIKKALQFLLASNFSEVITVLTATIIGFTLFKPVHLLFINLITDSLPAVALGMEHAEPAIMERPPRGSKEGVFSDGVGFNIAYQGVAIAALTLAAYFIVGLWDTHETAMTAAFFTLSICELFHAFALRSLKQSVFTMKKHNIALLSAISLSLALALSVIYLPPLPEIFSLAPLTMRELALSFGLSVLIVPFVEAVKAVQRGRGARRRPRVNI